ncbi:LysR family transcriptional regulator [Psychromarinibacter sp. C21-152]|uniref:LysR family transcriptional regulator n=1 Tax=Psychromarinibacter sediminicola TaxID=3033385 RepID=A0AAE3NUD7_9RHOB|nr:LysR family transcriptional regulator [Psychromarinibacter sediminicola]MDF0601140.1 LysR family transcriptional regulator [Psychromarinibacter sediminicola]
MVGASENTVSLVRAEPSLNLRHLRIFAAVAQCGSQHEAAIAVGVTQSAISQALRKLETLLGRRVFARGRHGMDLADEGRILLRRTQRMFATLEGMKKWVRNAGVFDNRLKMVHLGGLVELDRAKGYAAAARALGMSAPALHRSMREFSDLVGTHLVRWTGTSIETTRIGDHMARLAGLALAELQAAWADLDDHAGASSGQVRLGAIPIARTDILPDVVADICDTDPGVSLELVEADYETLTRALRRGALDIVLGASRGADLSGDLEEHVLFSDELSVFARKDHPLAGRRDLTLDDLVRYPWIAPRSGAPTRSDFEKLFEGHSVESGLITTSSLVIVRAVLARTDRLTLLSRRRVLYEEQQGLLTALDLALPLTRRIICVTTRRDWHPTRLQSDVMERLLRCT